MAGVKIQGILLLLSLMLCAVNSSKLIYRKYEKEFPEKKYVQVVEIFETRRAPPHFSQSDRELNDFLARDSYSTDMNCTKANETDKVEVVTRPATTTTRIPSIPTTAYRRATTPSTTPNLNNLFTIRTTKPTIKPNPPENRNPDYTNVLPWPNTNVQVTKHPPSTTKPTIMIKETDPTTNTTTHVENDFGNTTDGTESEFSDNEIIYADGDEELDGIDENYNEANYPDVIPPEQFEPLNDGNGTLSDRNDYDDDEENSDDDEEFEKSKRRKRNYRLTSLRASKRHNQLSENVS